MASIKTLFFLIFKSTTLKNTFVRITSVLFAWYHFGLMSYFPGIDGLKWKTGIFIAAICSACAFGLWFATLKFAAHYRLLKFILLIPSLVIFPMISFTLDPVLFVVSILSLVLAIQNVMSRGGLKDGPSQT